MSGLQAIISHGSGSSKAGVDDGGPAFQPMFMVAVEEVGDGNGCCSGGGLDGGECGVIVDNVVGEQRFVAAAAAEVERGEVIESAGSADGGKKENVFAIPEGVLRRGRFGLAIRGTGVELLLLR